jgi:thiamine pyrophosphate-dependent acetolactate synthase large subunit-like protein
MLLPALTTLGSFPAPNLKIFVFDNEAYEGTGGQPSDTARVADIAAMAQGAGVTGAKTVKDLDSFIGAAQEALNKEGMTFIVVKVELSKGPAPRKGVGHKEDLLQFVRYVEKTENLKVLHSEHY